MSGNLWSMSRIKLVIQQRGTRLLELEFEIKGLMDSPPRTNRPGCYNQIYMFLEPTETMSKNDSHNLQRPPKTGRSPPCPDSNLEPASSLNLPLTLLQWTEGQRVTASLTPELTTLLRIYFPSTTGHYVPQWPPAAVLHHASLAHSTHR